MSQSHYHKDKRVIIILALVILLGILVAID